ncbi:SMI1/KNR4 family protein [Neobacillus sp. FSL H8-0543]|uniref:SMI1/KNR4 family protein n=1 Tax=Neobacillus sp. FSL H8-0543 TaxID=2954672 RepID=UPI003158AF32
MINTYGLVLNPPIDRNKVKKVESVLGVAFPDDYVEFITYTNGAEGSIDENYLVLWAIDEIIELNEGYSVYEFAKGLVIFGSDGGETAFAFDTRTTEMQIVAVPFIGMDLDEVTTCSKTYNGFLKYFLHTS